jgi:hypothetical protein
MELGRHLRELFRLRLSVVVCFALAALAAVNIVYHVPSLEPRQVDMASSTTELLVDTPLSTVLDLRQGSSELEKMTSRAVLIGNVMASPPVLAYIGRRAGVPPSRIRAQPPLTPDFPRALSGLGEDPHTSDLLKSTDQYRLNIQSNPTVPILQIYAQAPSAKAAATLANASVDGLRDYLDDTAKAQGTPKEELVRLEQLGRAEGVVINGGIRYQLVVLTFMVVFAFSSATAILIARVRRGWRESGGDLGADEAVGLVDPEVDGFEPAQDRPAVTARSA